MANTNDVSNCTPDGIPTIATNAALKSYNESLQRSVGGRERGELGLDKFGAVQDDNAPENVIDPPPDQKFQNIDTPDYIQIADQINRVGSARVAKPVVNE